jgi:hypothetical protein
MRRWAVGGLIGVLAVFLGTGGYFYLNRSREDSYSLPNSKTTRTPGKRNSASAEIDPLRKPQAAELEAVLSDEAINAMLAPKGIHLHETEPPKELPLVTWGKRDHFPMIRKPKFITAGDGDQLLAKDEPVLGLVVGPDTRAYSTNQLNRHEMVLDEVGGVPVLVTY